MPASDGCRSEPVPERSTGGIVVIGGGPAGLAAARELTRLGASPTVLEKSGRLGGLARTDNHNGFRFDIGGHRFFTKSRTVEQIWADTLGPDLLQRKRLSRIYYNGKFFDYPLQPWNVLRGLGAYQSVRLVLSHLKWRVSPYPLEDTFEQWVTNRFGRRLFLTFFKAYTEKVWGVPCSELKAEWAAQRIKDLSFLTAVRSMFIRPRQAIRTLIDRFQYPRLGPGMMWEAVGSDIARHGADVRLESDAVTIRRDGLRITGVDVARGGERELVSVSQLISSMPVTELVARFDPVAPEPVRRAAARLRHRDFLTVCLIVDQPRLFPDNWIYVHDTNVRVSRIQNFKNWSPDMVPDERKTSLGLEYFCTEGDDLWSAPDASLLDLASRELEAIGLARRTDVEDGYVIRAPKAYPIYDSRYREALDTVRAFLGRLENLQTIGRNGLHRYDNQDHAMLTGILAARNVAAGEHNDVWQVNADQQYHEEVRPARVLEPHLAQG
jgi:protoporphyrinogen oxidase